jgi:hypothetical protein
VADGAKPKDSNEDSSRLGSVYKDPYKIFSFSLSSAEETIKDCVFVLDTNVLLIPFGTGKQPLDEIGRIYKKLAKEKRLKIPAQVAREFASLRATKLTTVYQQLGTKRDKISIKTSEYPLLESLNEYQLLLKAEKSAQDAIRAFQDSIDTLLETIRNWRWNDPVSELYREIFTGETIAAPQISEDEFQKEASDRFARRIPPGYKDAAKEENAFGDLIIWKTILQVGRIQKKSVIFVSGDEKPDWWHQSNNVALYPRYELVEEFRRTTEGKSFHIFTFAEFLRRMGANATTVSQVETEAVRQSVGSKVNESRDLYPEIEVANWFRRTYGTENVRTVPADLTSPFDILVTKPTGLMGVWILSQRPSVIRECQSLLAQRPTDVTEVCLFFLARNETDIIQLSLRRDEIVKESNVSAYVGLFRTDGTSTVRNL